VVSECYGVLKSAPNYGNGVFLNVLCTHFSAVISLKNGVNIILGKNYINYLFQPIFPSRFCFSGFQKSQFDFFQFFEEIRFYLNIAKIQRKFKTQNIQKYAVSLFVGRF